VYPPFLRLWWASTFNDMKISNRTHPILEKMKNKSLGIIPIFEDDKSFFDLNIKFYTHWWKFKLKEFGSDVNIITENFDLACKKAEDKLHALILDIMGNDTSDLDVSGTVINGGLVYMVDYHLKKGSEDCEIFLYIFTKEGTPIAFLVDSAKYGINLTGWVSKTRNLGKNEKEISHFLIYHLEKAAIYFMFKKYAEVETKYLQPNKKTRDIFCKYKNETATGITILDSKWFTNLVKSDAFNVRGHFRLQPKKKNGEWAKELIWINEFQKSGYISRAKKLSHER
jgi:hypothetical protein